MHCWWINSLRPRRSRRHFADDIFKRIFLNENVRITIKISLKFVFKSPIDNIPPLFQIMAWRRPGDKPLSEAMMVSLLTHICVTRPQWVNPPSPVFYLWPRKVQTNETRRYIRNAFSLWLRPCSGIDKKRALVYGPIFETDKLHNYLLITGPLVSPWHLDVWICLVSVACSSKVNFNNIGRFEEVSRKLI